MRIAIDVSKAVNEKAGIARYTMEIAKNMPKYFPYERYFYFFNFMRGNKYKSEIIKKIISDNRNISYKIYRLPGSVKEILFSSNFSILNWWLKDYDIYHATEFLSFDIGLKIPQILTVHDLSMIKFPEHRGAQVSKKHGKMLKNACQKADMIISVSKSTKDDIIKYFDIPFEKIKVIYSGYDNKFKPLNDNKLIQKTIQKYNIKLPYILFVGTIEPRKNIKNLILAFDKFVKTNQKNYQLILVGKKGWNTDDIEQVYNSVRSKEKIFFLDYVDDEDLVYLYNGASLFCYPSIYEGFGFPLLEAMACGTPSITSDISSLPEVAGSAAYLVNPSDYNSIYQGIKKMLSNKSLLFQMKEKSLLQAKKFTWEECVTKTYQIYKEVVKAKK